MHNLFGDGLRKIRQEENISIKELINGLGITNNERAMIENGTIFPNIDMIKNANLQEYIRQKILNVYYELDLSKENRIIYANEVLNNMPLTPNFESDKNEYPSCNTNCYAYVLQLAVNPRVISHKYMFMPGFFSGRYKPINFSGLKLITKSFDGLVSLTREDLRAINIGAEISSLDEEIDLKYSYKILILAETYDGELCWHYIRLNDDNNWSEKTGFDGEVRKCEDINEKIKKYRDIVTLKLTRRQ